MLMRLVAGLWFAVTGFLLGLISFMATSWTFHPIQSREFAIFAVVTTALFGLFGAVIGGGVVFMPRVPSAGTLAAARGAVVAALAFALYILGVTGNTFLNSIKPDWAGFVFGVFYLTAVWGSFGLIPCMMIGALSGWMLYRFSSRSP
jgi:hypothetical protein